MPSSSQPWRKKGNAILRELLVVDDPAFHTGTSPNVRVQEVQDDSDIARVVCTCGKFRKPRPGNAFWCPHAQRVYEENLDGRGKDGGPHPLAGLVEVTVLEKPKVVILVSIATTPQGFYEVAVGDHRGKREAIGLITAGDGRRVIRSMYFDWLVERAATRGLPDTCPSPHHHGALPWRMIALPGHATRAPREEFSIDFDPRDRRHVANYSDLLLTNACRPCNENNGVPDV